MQLPSFIQQVIAVKDKLFRFAYRLTGQRSQAEDVVQEVFLRIWNNQDRMAQIKNVEAFCMQIARNLSIDALRQKDNQHKGLDKIQEANDIDLQTPEQQTLFADQMQTLQNIIAKLPLKQKMVLQLRDVEEMSYQEIADALEISLDQVKVNLFRARNFIREQLSLTEQYGLQSHQ